jgi:hypothetical protein
VTEQQLARLGEHVAAEQDALPAPDPSARTRRLLAERAAARRRPGVGPGGLPVWARLSLAALLLSGLLALAGGVLRSPPLSFTVGGQGNQGVLMAWESAPPAAHLPLRFSDGTRIELGPNARARVVAVGRAGAEVVIESGRAHVDVVPARLRLPGESAWRVSLGPFAVEVKGTRFDVQWEPHAGELELDLFEGSVTVSGCEAGQSHTLVAGQGLRASCRQRGWTVLSLGELARREATPAPLPAAPALEGTLPDAVESPAEPLPAVERETLRTRPRRGAAAALSAPSWQQLAREGRYASAYAAALSAGFERESARAAASDLVLLGDTARLQGDEERARHAYTVARGRFPGSAAAGNAAFALGRLAVEAEPDAALQWFERYLREQPQGPLAAAADDWLFELAARAAEPGRLREVATTYLRRRPAGAHAADARRILGVP